MGTRTFRRSEWMSIMNRYVKTPKSVGKIVDVDESLELDGILVKLTWNLQKTGVRLVFSATSPKSVYTMSNNNAGGNTGSGPLSAGQWLAPQGAPDALPSMLLQAVLIDQVSGASYDVSCIVGPAFKSNSMSIK